MHKNNEISTKIKKDATIPENSNIWEVSKDQKLVPENSEIVKEATKKIEKDIQTADNTLKSDKVMMFKHRDG